MPSKRNVSKRKHCSTMAEVRAEIDALDRAIVALLAARLHYIDEAARIKQTRDQVRDEARIAEVLAKVGVEARRLGIDPVVVTAAYRSLVEASIAHELDEFDRRRGSAA
jgi:isochorismate pyruvate lyase